MPRVIRSEEFDQIAEVVGRFPDGAELDEILGAIGGGLSRRTLQRRLADLIAERRVIGNREQKSFKYRLAPITGTLEVTEESDRMEAQGEVYVPTSPEGAEIKAYVRQPIQGCRPVSVKYKNQSRVEASSVASKSVAAPRGADGWGGCIG